MPDRYSLVRSKSRLALRYHHQSEDRCVRVFSWMDRCELTEERRAIEIDYRDEARKICKERGYKPFDEKRLRLIIANLYYICWRVKYGESDLQDKIWPQISHTG